MSLRAVLEVVIHLESFRNIDLFFQGIYYTRFRIHSKKKIDSGSGAPTKSHEETKLVENQANTLQPVESNCQVEYAQPYCSYVSYYQ